MARSIAIIPARGGSKRIPRKNIKEFYGKPLIAYSIQAALGSKLFDKIIVTTDDEEIASVAKKYGAEVPFIRPEYLWSLSPCRILKNMNTMNMPTVCTKNGVSEKKERIKGSSSLLPLKREKYASRPDTG